MTECKNYNVYKFTTISQRTLIAYNICINRGAEMILMPTHLNCLDSLEGHAPIIRNHELKW